MQLSRAMTLSLLLLAAACANGEGREDNWMESTGSAIIDTLQTPFVDLNLKREVIPQTLQGCSDDPYAMPLPPVCYNIQRELKELDGLLGPDMEARPLPWNAPNQEDEFTMQKGMKEGGELARQQAIGMVSGKVNVMPFRGVVRRVTGAEKHAKEVTRAYDAGRLRRSYLKGLSKAYDCAVTPTPLLMPPP